MLLTNTKAAKLRKAFPNNSSAYRKLSKTQLHKIWQSGGFLNGILGPLLKNELDLMKNVLKPLAKSFLIPLGLKVPASATYPAIHKNIFGSGMATLIISNEKMNDIMKMVKFFEKSGLLIKDVREIIKNKRMY